MRFTYNYPFVRVLWKNVHFASSRDIFAISKQNLHFFQPRHTAIDPVYDFYLVRIKFLANIYTPPRVIFLRTKYWNYFISRYFSKVSQYYQLKKKNNQEITVHESLITSWRKPIYFIFAPSNLISFAKLTFWWTNVSM